MPRLHLGRWLGVTGAAALLGAQLAWTGQPDGTGGNADIAAYYGHHTVAVWGGNGLWLAGTAMLLVAVWRILTTQGAPGALGIALRDLSVVAAALMVVSSLTALALTIVAKTSDAAAAGRLWDIEANLFVLAAWTWMAFLVLAALHLREARVSVAAAAVAVAALAVFDLDAAWPMFLAWVAVGAALAPVAVTRPAVPPAATARQ